MADVSGHISNVGGISTSLNSSENIFCNVSAQSQISYRLNTTNQIQAKLNKINNISGVVYATSVVNNYYLTPDQFGAKGDGITDDTEAFKRLAESVVNNTHVIIPNKVYILDDTITFSNANHLYICNYGILRRNKRSELNNVFTECVNFSKCDYLHLYGLFVDCNEVYARCVNIRECKNVIIDNLTIMNVGKKDFGSNHVVGLGIWGKSYNVNVSNSNISHIYSNETSSGILIQDGIDLTGEYLPENITITESLITDIYPKTDGDGIKVLNSYNDKNVNLTVSDCTFIDCRKRALKFQARGCHSLRNTLIWNEKGYCAIDFQRGYGTSTDDVVISNYTTQEKDNTEGFFEFVIGCEGSYNQINNLGYFIKGSYSWMVNHSYSSFSGYGALINLGSVDRLFVTDSKGEYITPLEKTENTKSHHNLINGVYGNGVVKHLLNVSFLCEENVPSDESLVNNMRFNVFKNELKNINIIMADRKIITNSNNYAYNSHIDFRFNSFVNVHIDSASDNTETTVILPDSYVSGELTCLFNEFDISFRGVLNAQRFSFSNIPTDEFIHKNSISFVGSYIPYQNIVCKEKIRQQDSTKEYPETFKTRVKWFSDTNPQNDDQTWRIDWVRSCDVNDICINTTSSSLIGWRCISKPTTTNINGMWEEI